MATDDVGSFRGLYYPHSLPLSVETLKRALLIFDQVLFVDPRTPRVQEGQYSETAHQRYLPFDAPAWQRRDWEDSVRVVGPLIAAGVARYIDPTPLLDDESAQQAMTADLQADMGRHETFMLFDGSPPGWCLLRSRIPRSCFRYLHHQYTPRVFYLENTKRPFDSSFGYHALFADGKPDQEYGVPPSPGSQPDVNGEYACVVPYYLGSSLAVSLAVAAARMVGAIPFTDSAPHQSLLLARTGTPVTAGQAADLLDSALTATELRALSIEEVLEVRTGLAETRARVAAPLQQIAVPDQGQRANADRAIIAAATAGRAADDLVRVALRRVAPQAPQVTKSRTDATAWVSAGDFGAVLWIDPVEREFAPRKDELQRRAWTSAAPAVPVDQTNQLKPRRRRWIFWKRSS
jgi:hypothetical protein